MPGSGAPREAASAGPACGPLGAGRSAAEGARLHCEPMGRALFQQRVFDWLDARLASGPPARG
ncbi:hypothetical protein Srufu_002060 [Streptomyces libani subsp. rufus]|nr:hypothetical protein Srufu_002060 [Streptomyces libani subsp. rufus]